MNEQELFDIQHGQLNEEIAKINWISDNKKKLIHELRKVVANSNAEYFDDENLDVNEIFRGNDFRTWISSYVSHELLKEVTDK